MFAEHEQRKRLLPANPKKKKTLRSASETPQLRNGKEGTAPSQSMPRRERRGRGLALQGEEARTRLPTEKKLSGRANREAPQYPSKRGLMSKEEKADGRDDQSSGTETGRGKRKGEKGINQGFHEKETGRGGGGPRKKDFS